MSEAEVRVKLAIVDDERDMVDVYLRLFRMKQMEVCFVAGNGAEAVELYRHSVSRPEIVIMDNRMPLMNGIEAMKMITAMGNPVKFIFLSADTTISSEATKLGAVFLKKPASVRELLQAIESIAGRPDDRAFSDGACGGGFSYKRAAQ